MTSGFEDLCCVYTLSTRSDITSCFWGSTCMFVCIWYNFQILEWQAHFLGLVWSVFSGLYAAVYLVYMPRFQGWVWPVVSVDPFCVYGTFRRSSMISGVPWSMLCICTGRLCGHNVPAISTRLDGVVLSQCLAGLSVALVSRGSRQALALRSSPGHPTPPGLSTTMSAQIVCALRGVLSGLGHLSSEPFSPSIPRHSRACSRYGTFWSYRMDLVKACCLYWGRDICYKGRSYQRPLLCYMPLCNTMSAYPI